MSNPNGCSGNGDRTDRSVEFLHDIADKLGSAMFETLTRCQEECTKLIQEKRELERLLLREQESHNKTSDRLERYWSELEDLKSADAERTRYPIMTIDVSDVKGVQQMLADKTDEIAALEFDFDVYRKRSFKYVERLWSLLSADCGPEEGEKILAAVADRMEELNHFRSQFKLGGASSDSYYAMRNLRDTVQSELDALKKEYDEEVISHDIEEKDLKQKIVSLKSELAEIKKNYNSKSWSVLLANGEVARLCAIEKS